MAMAAAAALMIQSEMDLFLVYFFSDSASGNGSLVATR